MRGYIDGCSGDLIYGWFWFPGHPDQHVAVEIHVDGIPVAKLFANEYRSDLKQAGVGDGRYGFNFVPNVPIDVTKQEISIIADGKLVYPRGDMEDRLGLTGNNEYYRLPDLKGMRVLEIGCNEGHLARHILRSLQPAEYLGIDIWRPPYQTDELRERFRNGDIERRETLPLDQNWDVVICFDVFYHLMAPLIAIRNLSELAGRCLVFGSAIIPEGNSDSPEYSIEPHTVKGPVMRFAPMYAGDNTNFFYPTEKCIVDMLAWSGFRRIERQWRYKPPEEEGLITERASFHCWK